jgi:O-antigen ligase
MQREVSANGVALAGISPRESSRPVADLDLTRSLAGLKSVVLAAAAFFTIAGLAALLPLLGAAAAAVIGFVIALRRPGLLLALALNGFFVYLAVVDVAGRGTATLEYDVVLGGLMLFAAWRSRDLVFARLRARGRLETTWLVAAALLAFWFLLNGVLYRAGGHETRLLMGLLVIITIPSLLLAFSLDRRGLADLRLWIVALGLGMVLGDVVAAAIGTPLIQGRFSPIERLDPINAGLVPALAAAALISAPMRSLRGRALQTVLLAALVAATVIPGSRGPVATLALTVIVAAVLLTPRRLVLVAVGALAIGVPIGYAGSKSFGSESYLSQGVTDIVTGIQSGGGSGGGSGTPPAVKPGTVAPISTFKIRKYWITSALKAAPDKPVLGHGIVTLPDTSPEAYRMGVAGELIYPHNDLVESIYSLGIPGFVLFVLLLGLPLIAGYRLLRGRSGTLLLLAVLLFVFSFFESNFSGEIGADSALWASAGLLIALSLDRRRSAS